MNIEEATKLFESKGLFVAPLRSLRLDGIQIAGKVDRSSQIWELSDRTDLYPEDEHWVFDTSMKLPFPDQVIYAAPSLETATSITLDRYFGKATMIDGWLFPAHLHPEWDIEFIKKGLAAAELIKQKNWKTLKENFGRHSRFQGDSKTWLGHHDLVFLRKIEHDQVNSRQLWISRDTSKMYIVMGLSNEAE